MKENCNPKISPNKKKKVILLLTVSTVLIVALGTVLLGGHHIAKESGYYCINRMGKIMNAKPFKDKGYFFGEEKIIFAKSKITEYGETMSSFMDTSGKIIGDKYFHADDVKLPEKPTFPILVREDDKLVILDNKLEKIGELKGDYDAKGADFSSCFVSGLAFVGLKTNRDLQYGYINTAGEWVIPPRFSDAYSFSEYGIAMVEENDSEMFGLIDTKGNYISKDRFCDVYNSGKYPMVQKQEDGKAAFINSNGEYITDFIYEFETSGFSEGLASVILYKEDEYSYGFINEQGEMVITIAGTHLGRNSKFSHGVAWIVLGNAVDKDFHMAIEAKNVKETRPFSEDGYSVVSYGNYGEKYGLIDSNGKWVLKPQFLAKSSDGKAIDFPEYNNGYLMVYLEKGQSVKK